MLTPNCNIQATGTRVTCVLPRAQQLFSHTGGLQSQLAPQTHADYISKRRAARITKQQEFTFYIGFSTTFRIPFGLVFHSKMTLTHFLVSLL